MELILTGNCVDIMSRMDADSIDMVLTSPPYDDLREYKGYDFDYKAVANELYRLIKPGGIVVWVVGDATKNGSETLNSFRHALYFQEIGFSVHDTMIYRKLNPIPNAGTRYQQSFEYMFVFSKKKPKTHNISKRPRSNKTNDKRTYRHKKWTRKSNGEFTQNDYYIKDEVPDWNIWDFYVGGGNSTNDKVAYEHPAIFPEALAERHILSWSNEGDIVLDPMCGSGTTLKMAKKNGRGFIGIDVSADYVEIAKKRTQMI